MRKLNIGIDIDDTITDTYYNLLPIIAIKYNINLNKLYKKKYTYGKMHKLLPNYLEFCRENSLGVIKIVPLKKDVIKVFNKFKEDGHNIIFITARDHKEYDDPYKVCYDYLINNGVKFDKIIVDANDKAKECLKENIDLFIDDNTNNCLQVSSSGVPTLQYHNDFTTHARNVKRVYDWNEIYNIVCQMSS